MNKATQLVLGNVLVFAVMLVIVEVILQVAGIGNFGSAPLNPDPVFHHVHPADYTFVSYSPHEEFDPVEVRYDRQGYRVSGQEKAGWDRPWVAFLGDSFVESNQVAYDSSFIGLLQAAYPGMRMRNFGVSSYSPALEYLVARHHVFTQETLPARVFLLVYANDVRDDEEYLAQGRFEGETLARVDGGNPGQLLDMVRRTNLFRLLRRTQILISYRMKAGEQRTEQRVVRDQVDENPDWTGSQSAVYVEKIASLCEEKGIPFHLMAVPSKYADFQKDYGYFSFPAKVAAWAESRTIPYIDLAGPFQAWGEAGGSLLFFDHDIHFNHAGHAVVARTIAPYLAEDPRKQDEGRYSAQDGLSTRRKKHSIW
ncbi:MAG: hypothetical protein RLY31_911 [Bacteroidota bacterium]|jgi:hypothetical protein